MPYKPEASSAAKARYGFASAPGIRVSGRSDAPCPTMRKPQVRLSCAHASVVGAQLPAAYRLYELIVGARKSASSRAPAIHPARNRSNTEGSAANAFSPSRHSDAWMWHELAIHVWSGFAMNVI